MGFISRLLVGKKEHTEKSESALPRDARATVKKSFLQPCNKILRQAARLADCKISHYDFQNSACA